MALASRTGRKSKELAYISEKIRGTKFKTADLIIPIVVLIILIILSVFVFVPMVTTAMDYQREIKDKKESIVQMRKLVTSLENMDENQLTEDVLIAKGVIPRVLKVSDFIYYIDNLAREKGLVMRELSAGDALRPGQEQSGAGVSGPISYTGEYVSIVSFLEEVQTISPYIIRLQNVEVGKSAEDLWHVNLRVSGYYMRDRTTSNINIYAPFRPYTDYPEILEVFREKAKKL
jgi:Tfp pilus assembly protein PilO